MSGQPACALAMALHLASCGCDSPSGAGPGGGGRDPYAEARARMVSEQLAAPGRDIRDPAVLEAMGRVPRHAFVPESQRSMAYEDRPLPIGHGQTISQPYIVAFMTEQVKVRPGERVLEIGTGSGYQAAVLACLGAEVYSVEIVEALADRARLTLSQLGIPRVQVRAADGYLGWRDAAPFDVVMVTCAPNHVPSALVEQLREGGRMIIPVGESGFQELHLLEKRGPEVRERAVLPVRFVPMTGRAREAGGTLAWPAVGELPH